MESALRSPSAKQEKTDALSGRAVESPSAKHPLELLFRLRAFEARRHREFGLLWYGQIFASMGTWMDQVTRGWLIYDLTDSALQLVLVRGILMPGGVALYGVLVVVFAESP